MKKFFDTLHTNKTDIALLLMRLVFGGFMIFGHGWRKLMNFGDIAPKFAEIIPIGSTANLALTVFAEVFCAALIVIGLGTRLAAIPLIITMLVAAFIAHGGDPFGKKEMALLYLAGYTALLLAGSGKYSIDSRLRQ